MGKLNLNEDALSFTVKSVDKIAKGYAGAEGQFSKGDVFDFGGLIDAINWGSETINGYCETRFDEYDKVIFLVFMAGNPNAEEDGEDYIEDCYVSLEVGLDSNRKVFGDIDELINDSMN